MNWSLLYFFPSFSLPLLSHHWLTPLTAKKQLKGEKKLLFSPGRKRRDFLTIFPKKMFECEYTHICSHNTSIWRKINLALFPQDYLGTSCLVISAFSAPKMPSFASSLNVRGTPSLVQCFMLFSLKKYREKAQPTFFSWEINGFLAPWTCFKGDRRRRKKKL